MRRSPLMRMEFSVLPAQYHSNKKHSKCMQQREIINGKIISFSIPTIHILSYFLVFSLRTSSTNGSYSIRATGIGSKTCLTLSNQRHSSSLDTNRSMPKPKLTSSSLLDKPLQDSRATSLSLAKQMRNSMKR